MKGLKTIIVVVVAAFGGAVLGTLATLHYLRSAPVPYRSISDSQHVRLTGGADSSTIVESRAAFKEAASDAVKAVVHVKVSYGPGSFSLNPLELAYEPPAHPSGSGVILTEDGYIVTNNHVIENASNIEVVLNNNQRYFANLVGADPSTDIALLKINATGLPFVRYGNSDGVEPGQWVLAIGNPFNLSSTVTAGIVSAKARNIGVLRDRNNLQVESFIQTDAAVNPGNSGGALINLQGELIGINTAIATSTGNYAGYAFAIPVNLVKKVVDDLLQYGNVQRGLLGVQIEDVDADKAEDFGIPTDQGVLIDGVNRGSAADLAGIHSGDVIIGIGDSPVRSVSELQELVAINRPGSTISVRFIRDGKSMQTAATLRTFDGSPSAEPKAVKNEFDGTTFAEATHKQLTELNLDAGVVVSQLGEGAWKRAGMKEKFVVAYIDKVPVSSIEELNQLLSFKHGGILVEGFYPDGERGTYGVEWDWRHESDDPF